jgi:methylthioribulose-1-phosphate dehydratase
VAGDPRALIETVRRMYARGWAPGTGGNMSVVVPGPRLLITASGVDKRVATVDDLVVVGLDGVQVAGTGRPSAETAVHLELVRWGAKAVLHAHSVWNTLASLLAAGRGQLVLHGLEMLKGLAGVDTHEHREVVPVVANHQDTTVLARAVHRVIAEHPRCHGVLVAGHGLYTWGASLVEAERHVEIFEFLFEVLVRAKELPHGTVDLS